MSYEVIKLATDKLTYREKMKLSHYLIQAAIKEEETINPSEREIKVKTENTIEDIKSLNKEDLISYVKERLSKSKPVKIKSLKNFIESMFQFQGGIETSKIDEIIKNLEKENFLTINGTKVNYL